ncbi:MAG: biotin/lipoyl-binding protein, partial [Cyanobacteria bacterium P01_A01_bin.37]
MIQDTQNTESKKPQNNKMEQPGEARQLELVLLGDDSSNDAPERHTEHVSNAQPLQTMAARPRLRFGRSAWGAVGLAVLLSGVAIAGMRQGTLFPASSNAALATQTNAAQANAIEVDAIELESTDSFTVARRYAGEIVAGRTSELGFERSGELVWLGVDRGDRIEAGQVLARLDTRQLQAQRSQLIAQWDQAQALLRELEAGPRTEAIEAARSRVQDLDDQLQLARIQQTRREYLYDEGAISRDQLDEVAFDADALQDRMATAQSQLDELLAGTRVEQVEAQQSVVRQLTARIDDIDIAIEKGSLIAPFSG